MNTLLVKIAKMKAELEKDEILIIITTSKGEDYNEEIIKINWPHIHDSEDERELVRDIFHDAFNNLWDCITVVSFHDEYVECQKCHAAIHKDDGCYVCNTDIDTDMEVA